jgi:hypothetical protein
MASHDFLTQKAINCASFIERVIEKYETSEEISGIVKTTTKRVKEDSKLRDQLTDPTFRAVLLSQMPILYGPINVLRGFYHCSDEERLTKVEVGIKNLEEFHANIGSVIEKLKANPEEISVDLRTLGAYAEIFFGSLVDSLIPKSNNNTIQ